MDIRDSKHGLFV